MAEQQDDKTKADGIVHVVQKAEAHTTLKQFSMPGKTGGIHFYVGVVVLKAKTMAYPSLVVTYASD